MTSELSLWIEAAVGGRNVGREEISESAGMSLQFRLGQASRRRGEKKKPQVALCGAYTSLIVLSVLESEEKPGRT